jgi:hypothetical protein
MLNGYYNYAFSLENSIMKEDPFDKYDKNDF